MKLMQKILLVTDLGPSAETAANTTAVLAEAFHSEIILLHVIPSILDSSCNLAELQQIGLQELREIAARLEKNGDKAATCRVECGVPLDHTLQLASEFDVNVIVQAADNYEPATGSAAEVGIAAERVVRKSTKPVWTVKGAFQLPPKNILCPVDFSQASSRALKSGSALAKTFGAILHVVHVIPPVNKQSGSFEPLYARVRSANLAPHQRSLEEYIRAFDFHQTKWQTHLLQGDPGEQILAVAREEKADIMMMGALGETKSEKLQLGALASRLLRTAPCAVVTFKDEHAIRVSLDSLLTDLETRFRHGKELLEKGHAEEALPFFLACVEEDAMFVPAWEGIAEARHRLGQEDEANLALENARQIQRRIWERRVEFELKHHYWQK
ncbi:universal stress protein [candidate division FCPU426 bacterium]|nr:universal stress protein [candidate division FCPU426 bacterium]